jgi:hypothetical protein
MSQQVCVTIHPRIVYGHCISRSVFFHPAGSLTTVLRILFFSRVRISSHSRLDNQGRSSPVSNQSFLRILPVIKGPYGYYFRQDSIEKDADLFFLFFSFQHFLNPVFYDFSYQVIGNWCVQRKLDSPLRLFIRRQLFRERSDR